MLSVPTQFYKLSKKQYKDDIVTRKFRPSVNGSLPIMLQKIIKESWDDDPAKRPTFDRIAVLLKAEYQSMVSGDMKNHSERLVDKSTRSFRARVRSPNQELVNDSLHERD